MVAVVAADAKHWPEVVGMLGWTSEDALAAHFGVVLPLSLVVGVVLLRVAAVPAVAHAAAVVVHELGVGRRH